MSGRMAFRATHRARTAVVLALKMSLCAISGLLKRAGVRAARVCTGLMSRDGGGTVSLVPGVS